MEYNYPTKRKPYKEKKISTSNRGMQFEEMINNIEHDATKFVNRARIQQNQEREEVIKPTATNSGEAPTHRQAVSKKVGRNEPCPCGSGKKYKNCCGR